MRPTLLATLLFLFTQQLSAQLPVINFNKIGNEDGLSQATVNVSYRDSEGFLWFGTDDGLNRYDGKSMQKYYSRYYDDLSLSANEVYGICEDKQGRLWLAHYNAGISILNKQTNQFQRLKHQEGKPGLSNNKIYGLLRGKGDIIWARTVKGITAIDPSNWHMVHYEAPSFADEDLSDNVSIVEWDGSVWFGGKNSGLHHVNADAHPEPQFNWNAEQWGKHVAGVIRGQDNSLLAVSEKGLYRITNTGQQYSIRPVITDSVIFKTAEQLAIDPSTGMIWITSSGEGIYIVNASTGKVLQHVRSELTKDNLTSNSIHHIITDEEKNIILSTGRGVNIYSPYSRLFNNYENMFSKVANFGHPVYAIQEIEEERLLLGNKKGVYHFDPANSDLQPVKFAGDKAEEFTAYHFVTFMPGVLFVCTDKGVFEVKRQGDHFSLQKPGGYPELALLEGIPVTDIYKASDSIAWITSYTKGLYKWNLVTHQFRQFLPTGNSSGPVFNRIMKLVPVAPYKYLLCTTSGFSLFNTLNEQFENFAPGDNYPYQLPARNIKSGLGQGRYIWVTTYGAGLQRYDTATKKFEGFTTANGLPNDAVYAVLQDDHGLLWAPTNNGLAAIDPKTWTAKSYSIEDGLTDNEFNGFASYKSHTGKLFFSTLNGIVNVDPQRIRSNPYQPRIVLTGFHASNNSSDTTFNIYGQRSFWLPAGYNYLDISFAALSYASPDKNKYKVLLKGFQNNWSDIGHNNQVRYTNLPPGDYTLQVMATNNSGIWSNDVLNVSINIQPHWYQTTLFKVLLGIAIVAIILLATLVIMLRISNRQKQRTTNELREKNTRIETLIRELHHRVKNNLQIVSSLLSLQSSRLKDDNARLAMEEGKTRVDAMAMIHQGLYMADDLAAVDMEHYIRNLCQSLAYSFGYDESNIRAIVTLENKALDIDRAIPVGLIINELVTNAFKHAFSGVEKPMVEVSLQLVRGRISLTVKDNGLTSLKPEQLKRSGSFGMKLIHTLVTQLDGDMEVTYEEGMKYQILLKGDRLTGANI